MSRALVGVAVMSRPSTSTRPVSGSSSPASTRRAVVLPQPEGPSSATNSPGAMSSVSPSRACTGPYAPPQGELMSAPRMSATDRPDGTRQGVAVALYDLRRAYGPVRALDGLTLDIAPGEFVALLGPSGCGKTTALRVLAGLEDPDTGRVEVDGRDITATPTSARDMGMVFQAYSLFPHMTARQNVEFGLQLRRIPSARRRTRASEMLDLVELSDHADRYAHQ